MVESNSKVTKGKRYSRNSLIYRLELDNKYIQKAIITDLSFILLLLSFVYIIHYIY